MLLKPRLRRAERTVVALAFLALLSLISVIPTSAAIPTLGPWTETTDYGASAGSSGTGGVTVQSESCVIYNGYLYCVGGVVSGAYSSKSFFAPATHSGVGGWSETTDYGAASGTTGSGGLAVGGESCVGYGGDVYCVGGHYYNPSTHNSGSVSNVYFAPLSASGVGAWTETTDYGAASGSSGTGGVQVSYESCVTSGAYIYCIGGKDANFNGLSKVFYAQMSSTGIGAWTETTDYGAASGATGSGGVMTNPECFAPPGHIVCIGGAVNGNPISKLFYTALSTAGVGPWTEGTDYGATSGSTGSGGTPVYGLSCAAFNSSAVCVGGWDGPTNAVNWVDASKFPPDGVSEPSPVFSARYNTNCVDGTWEDSSGYHIEIYCVGGNNGGSGAAASLGAAASSGDLSDAWFTQIAYPTSTTSTTTTSAPTSASTTTTSSSQSTSPQTTTTASSSSGGGIPEFPAGSFATIALTAVVIVSYFIVRSRRE